MKTLKGLDKTSVEKVITILYDARDRMQLHIL